MITIDPKKKKELINQNAEQSRANAHKKESDPLFFKWKRGEITEQEYLSKVEEIRARYPYA